MKCGVSMVILWISLIVSQWTFCYNVAVDSYRSPFSQPLAESFPFEQRVTAPTMRPMRILYNADDIMTQVFHTFTSCIKVLH